MRKRMLVTVPSLAATAFVIYVVPALAGFGGGGGGQGHMKLLWSLGACVVAASASALVGALA